jgi:PKD repeat protein
VGLRARRHVVNASSLKTIAAVIVLCGVAAACSESPEKPAEKPVAAPIIEPDKPDMPTGQPIIAWIEAEPEEGEAPLRVQFTAKLKGGKPPYTVKWIFGDESPESTELNPVHSYTAPGEFTVELYANDSTGDDDEDDVDILVE